MFNESNTRKNTLPVCRGLDLSAEQFAALRDYQSGANVNRWLRQKASPNPPTFSPELEAAMAAQVVALDSIFEQAPLLDSPLVVYRHSPIGIPSEGEFVDPCFTATSLNGQSTMAFARRYARPGEKHLIQVITVPAGTPIINVADYLPDVFGEEEILLPRGRRFSPVGQHDEGGDLVIETLNVNSE